jgi:hypothetical protein
VKDCGRPHSVAGIFVTTPTLAHVILDEGY